MGTTPDCPTSIVVLLSVTRPSSLVSTSIPSVFAQSKKPDAIYLAVDDMSVMPDKYPEDWINSGIKITKVVNRRTRNLSGAFNTAFGQIIQDGFNPERTYVAILDDDDWWEDEYLHECFNQAIQTGNEWIIPGLIRHEAEGQLGIPLSIPEILDEGLFLAGNPHIQGSNLFVKLSSLLLAGGFDEYLPSTTDRDLCIRLLRLGSIKYSLLNKHLVHHAAYGQNRLSEFGSRRKSTGLNRFYQKYKDVMTEEERLAHIKRSHDLFGCEIEPVSYTNTEKNHAYIPKRKSGFEEGLDFEIVIGAIASSLENALKLIREAREFQQHTHKIFALVIEDNYGDRGELTKEAKKLAESGISLRTISREECAQAADKGDLGTYYAAPAKRSGIPYGRTALHRYLYLECIKYANPVAWIVDDDVSLVNFYWGTRDCQLTENQFVKQIATWKNNGVSIVVGKVGGDPPVPAMSTARTSLLDLHFNLLAFGAGEIKTTKEERAMEWRQFTERFPDYHYDFPSISFGHLELPVWSPDSLSIDNHNLILEKLADAIPCIAYRSVFRSSEYPIGAIGNSDQIYEKHGGNTGPIRGGNTIVLDIDCLRTFFNGSPHSSGVPYRRGDTLWVTLNRRMGSRRPTHGGKMVISSPFMVIQNRIGNESPEEMKVKLVSDTLGSAFTRVFDRVLYERLQGNHFRTPDFYSALEFSDEDIDSFYARMKEEVERRAEQILLNSWRIRGLLMSIEYLVKNSGKLYLLNPETREKIVVSINVMLSQMREIWSEGSVKVLVNAITEFSKGDLFTFLKSLATSNRQFSNALPINYSSGEIDSISKEIGKAFNTSNLNILGKGKEGIVFTDGTSCFKYFHYGKKDVEDRQLKFLRENLVNRKLTHTAELQGFAAIGDSLILKEEYVEGEPYHGGLLEDMIGLLHECKESGIVIRNLAPKNLIVKNGHLKYVDIGRDITEYTEESYERMCRRTYLTYRWHFRNDLHEILHRSLTDTEFPEMFGYRWFAQSLEVKFNYQIIAPHLSKIFNRLNPNTILDYGCGNGIYAEYLSGKYKLAVYDIDMERFWKRQHDRLEFQVLDRKDLDRINSGDDKFDAVLLNLVLCSVDDLEVDRILRDVRNLVKGGGSVIITICNPFNIDVLESQAYSSFPNERGYGNRFPYEKKVKLTKRTRVDFHRPLHWYTSELKKHGFRAVNVSESSGVSIQDLSPGSDFLFIIAEPIPITRHHDVTLMIKASSMEWRSIDFQVRHIVSQLEGPEIFPEKILVTDNEVSGFPRSYSNSDMVRYKAKLQKLLADGIVDRVLFAPAERNALCNISERWFGVRSSERRSANGQPILTTLFGFENSKGQYILQLDSDCIIGRKTNENGYLDTMVKAFEENSYAVTASLPVYSMGSIPFRSKGGNNKWRTEVRNCLLNRSRLFGLLPLPNSLDTSGKLFLPWHRSLDAKLDDSTWESYRGSEGNAYFIHVPNKFKAGINEWFNLLREVENGRTMKEQADLVDLVYEDLGEILQNRNEKVIILVKGKDVPIPRLRRCFQSLLSQNYGEYGVIAIDAGSSNGMSEYLDVIIRKQFPGRFTLFRNFEPLTSMENIYVAITKLCTNPDSIIVMLDADDALIGSDALTKVLQKYEEGADLTVGTMLRADKYKSYPVDFHAPRENRGGNVWQHLRTFRKYLFDSINPEDFKIDGEWIGEADDWAYMLPLVELAQHPAHVLDTIYFYEPSKGKTEREKVHYEDTIGKIVSKESYKREVST